MTAFLTGAPLWVWPLLVVLVAVGLRSLRARTVPVALVYGLPALGVMALRTVAGLPAQGWIWGVFALAYALAYALGVWGGYRLQ
jgi:hypothetical protein